MTINRKSRSILEEISAYIPNKGKEDLIESRAQHIITSAIRLLETIDDNFSAADAAVLRGRFMSSIKGADPARFTRGVNKLRGN